MKRKALALLLIMGLCVGTASAQFGFGIVYDPTNYANALLSGQQSDLAACGGAASRGDVLRVFEKYALLSVEFTEPVAVFAGIAIDVADFRKLLTVRLANVEHV